MGLTVTKFHSPASAQVHPADIPCPRHGPWRAGECRERSSEFNSEGSPNSENRDALPHGLTARCIASAYAALGRTAADVLRRLIPGRSFIAGISEPARLCGPSENGRHVANCGRLRPSESRTVSPAAIPSLARTLSVSDPSCRMVSSRGALEHNFCYRGRSENRTRSELYSF